MRVLSLLLWLLSVSAHAETELHVMSYNIKALPSLILSGTYKETRFPLIGKILAGALTAKEKGIQVAKSGARTAASGAGAQGPHIVLLQEAFSVTESLFLSAAFPHVAEGPGPNSFLGVNSGLYILSRYPIEKQASRAFGRGNCEGWDCLSNKGVQFARITVPGLSRPLEVFNTHLQAGRDDKESRFRQVKILIEFFKEHHEEGNPVIFAGDFNFRPGLGQKSYLEFANALGFQHAGKHCLEKGCALTQDVGWHGIWERAVDHQFFAHGKGIEVVPLSVARTYREEVEGHKLSDHPAHEVRYVLRAPAGAAGRLVVK